MSEFEMGSDSEFFHDFVMDSHDTPEIAPKASRISSYAEIDPELPEPEALRRSFRGSTYPYPTRIDGKSYFRERFELQIELVKLQNWIKEHGEKIVVLFEGRDAAGKGSTIKRFMAYLNPRGARVVALEKPTEFERGQWYFQRYVDHLPTRGEIVFFDRSWYNRAGVERVMGFCSEQQYEVFLQQAPVFERMLVADSVRIFKFYLSISKEEQARRFEERRRNPLKQWKLSPVDIEAQERWDAYSEAKSVTMMRTNTSEVPWTLIKADDKLRARLEAMRAVLSSFDYEGRRDDVSRPPDPRIVAPADAVYG